MQKLSGEVVSVLGELAELQAASVPCASHDSRVVEYGRVRSTQTLVIHQWAGPSVIAKLAPDSTPDRAE